MSNNSWWMLLFNLRLDYLGHARGNSKKRDYRIGFRLALAE
jgi:hypothetical protein